MSIVDMNGVAQWQGNSDLKKHDFYDILFSYQRLGCG
jgi:hypothetical protein